MRLLNQSLYTFLAARVTSHVVGRGCDGSNCSEDAWLKLVLSGMNLYYRP